MINNFERLDEETEELASKVVDCAYTVYKNLQPGLLEKIYEVCLCHELDKKNISYKRQVVVPIKYDNITFEEAFRLDLLIENKIICELKASEKNHPVWRAQLLSYLKITDRRLGFLINFNTTSFSKGIQRVIL